MPKIETALVFENPEENSTLQVEMDTDGYSVTIFEGDDGAASMVLDRVSLVRLTNFLTDILNEGLN